MKDFEDGRSQVVFVDEAIDNYELYISILIVKTGLMSRVFTHGPGFNSRSSNTKDSKNGTWCRLA